MDLSVSRRFWLLSSLFLTFLASNNVQAEVESYANDFIDPSYIVKGNFGQNTLAAQSTIVTWAGQSAIGGPWSVMNKSIAPPSGDKHDYLSWSPYWWPNCTNVGNTTVLTPEQIWTTCPYIRRDGQFNPDVRTVINDVGNFQALSDAVLYNTLAWAITKQSSFAESTANFISTWFLDEATHMNPNLNYAQVKRGPGSTGGSNEGVLDLKCMTKIIDGILILRKGNSSAWTTDMDNSMNAWVTNYTNWLESAPTAIQESHATNNHGSYYYNQLASLKILLGDLTGARNATDTYFNTLYMSQIVEGGEQPFEAARTLPYHYRAYNLAAMITNARLAEYANPNEPVWNKTTNQGATIKDALDFAMTISPNATNEQTFAAELYPDVAAVASVYGDPDGKYATFLKGVDPQFAQEAFYLWDQPFAQQEGLAVSPSNSTPLSSSSGSTDGSNGTNESSGVISGRSMDYSGVLLGIVIYLLI